MTDYDGNLALQRRPAATVRKIGQVEAPRRSEFKTRRIPVEATPAPAIKARAQAAAIHRALSRRRLKFLAGVIGIIFMVTGIFTLVVYRQATILEMNFDNLGTERKIAKIEQECGQMSESLAQKTNLDQIRQQAAGRLGLQDPARSQVIVVSIPDSDRIVYASAGSSDTDNETYLADVFTNIEGYFRSIGQQGQGD